MNNPAKQSLIVILYLFQFLLIGNIFAEETEPVDPVLKELEELQNLMSTDPQSALPRLNFILEDSIQEKNTKHQTRAHMVLCSLHLQLEQSNDAIIHCEKSRELAISVDDKHSLAENLMILATAHSQKAEFDKALKLLNESEIVANANGDPSLKSAVYIMRGRFYNERSMSEAALEDLLAAYEIHQKDNNTRRIRLILSEIAKVYDRLKKYEKSIEYSLKAIDILDKNTEKMSLSIAYYNIGKTYRNTENLEKTHEYMNKALSISRKLNDELGIAYAQLYIAWVLKQKGKLNEAEHLYSSAKRVFKKQNNNRMLFTASTDLAELKLQSNLLTDAMEILKEARGYAEKLNTDTNWFRLHQVFAKVYLKNKNLDKYARHIHQQIQYQEEIHEVEKEIASKNLQMRFDFRQAETDNLLLTTKNELQSSQIERAKKEQQALFYALGLAFLTVGIIVYMLFRQISAREKFKRLALRDELTGAPNRRAILEFAKQHIILSKNTNSEFTIAIVDLDNFKSINDQFGHDVGDEVLKSFSDACRESLRGQDKYGRYGGEEWLIVFPATDTSHIEAIFFRIRERLSKMSIKGLPNDVEVTFSLGATQLIKRNRNLNALLKMADQHLYRAKQNGRNCFSY